MISQNLVQNIGWTLIHSLWQGFAIFIVLKITVRAVRNSGVRYFMGVAAMALMVIASVITFFVLSAKATGGNFQMMLNAAQATSSTQASSILDFINQNIIWFIRFWMIGFFVGLLRIAAGLYYINRLRRSSIPVHDEWIQMVRDLSESLNIDRIVAMAEANISAPMVVGFMKPVILFPIGLLSGLTAEQVETILVHELSHIRRQDYIINLVQSIVETIFFFNPFTLLMSSMIREERENCCDDMVIAKGISPISYVKTLAQLEAARTSSTLTLGFTGNQNQLLNRIKRIMENSAKNDWGKSRFVPVALLFLGLVCASWLSINSEKAIEVKTDVEADAVVADTLKENGFIVIKDNSDHGWPVIDPIEPEPSEIEVSRIIFDVPPIPAIPEIHEDFYLPDSIPGMKFKMREPIDFEEFEREFTEKFKSQFGEFYKKNEFEFQKMFDEAKRDQWSRREAMEVVDLDEFEHLAEVRKEMAELQAIAAEDMMKEAKVQQELAIHQLQKVQLDVLQDKIREQHVIVDKIQRQTEAYKEALVKMLTEDGYIDKNDNLDSFSINDDNGNLTINGHAIKEKDAVKYRALRDQYFGDYKRRFEPGKNE